MTAAQLNAGSRRKPYWGYWIGLCFLALQLVSIGYARFIPERFFCWAPYDQQTRYRLQVSVDGKVLTRKQVKRRYRYRDTEAWEARSISNLFSIIRQYESSYGKGEGAEVEILYWINGHPRQTWKWPEAK